MRHALIARILLIFSLFAGAALPARADLCSVTGTTLTFNPADVLANAPVDVSGTIAFSCLNPVALNQAGRACLSIGDPNGEAGGPRVAVSGVNQIHYDLYTDAARTARWSSWRTGTGAGLQVDFTYDILGNYAGSVPIYGRVFAGQQTVAAGQTYTETFANTVSNLYIETSGGLLIQPCTTVTILGSSWGSTMTVSIVVPNKCLVSGNAMSFGTATIFSADIDSSTNLSVSCSNALPYTVSLGNGFNGLSPATRQMVSGANRVGYLLFRDAGRTQIWGSTPGSDTLAGTGTGFAVSVPVYGRVPPQATPPPGYYTDSVVITVTY